MKITDVKLYVLENPDSRGSVLKLHEVPNLRRIQYTHGGTARPDLKERQHFIEVLTDEGISSRCTTTMTPDQVDVLRINVQGEDPCGASDCIRCCTKARAGCICLRDGLEISTTVSGTSPARLPVFRFMPSSAK